MKTYDIRIFHGTAFVFTCAIIASYLLFLNWDYGYYSDEGIWAYIGRAWHQYTSIPYVDQVENKTPGMFTLYALSHMIFGTTLMPMRIACVGMAVATAVFVYRIAAHWSSRATGLLALALYGSALGWQEIDGTLTAATETPTVLASCAAFWVLFCSSMRIPRALIGGVLMGIAISFKQSALITAGAFFLGILATGYTQKRSLRETAISSCTFLTGCLLSQALFVIPVILSGCPLQHYFSQGPWALLKNPSTHGSMSDFLRLGLLLLTSSKFSMLFLAASVFFPFFLATKRTAAILTALWFFVDAAVAIAPMHFFHHQFRPCIAPLIIIAVAGAYNVFAERSRMERIIVATIAIVMFFPTSEIVVRAIEHQAKQVNGYVTLADWIKKNTKQHDSIAYLSSQAASVAYLSDRRATGNVIINFMRAYPTQQDAMSEKILQEKPALLIVQRTGIAPEDDATVSRIFDRIKHDYTKLFDYHTFTIYGKNDRIQKS
jgi:4-amino-4-deoxy-L-arabinose transferase-like glycosyltransferase